MKRKYFTSKSGITLIALVVTVIVLIILAGVSINLLFGQYGVVTKAKDAKQLQEQAQLNEQTALNVLSEQMDQTIGKNSEATTPTITIKDLRAGDYIKYDTGVEGIGVINCRVLYEASSQYGLQIISDKNVADVTLGGSDWATASASYNSAIETLNNEAEKYLNTTYAIDARCVGSLPIIDANGNFTEKDTENEGPVELRFESTVEGANNMKGTDTNYTTDQTQMKDANVNIWTTGEKYWIASRYVHSFSSYCRVRVRYVVSSGALDSDYLCAVYSDGRFNGISNSSGLRPCFSLRSDIVITGGDGTSKAPYTM